MVLTRYGRNISQRSATQYTRHYIYQQGKGHFYDVVGTVLSILMQYWYIVWNQTLPKTALLPLLYLGALVT